MSQAPATISPALRVDICVCTFRRPQLGDTLRSLAALRLDNDWSVRLIVADNDAAPSARSLVEVLRAELPFPLVYVHCPSSNISIARNACLDAADGDFLALLDDDETASPGWLAELLKAAGETGADAVLGPVRAVYADNAPGWMRQGDFHSTAPVWVRGCIRTGYTCNALLRRASVHLSGRRFNLASGQSGGEDTEFFAGFHVSGGTIAFAPEALVYEAVPPSRASRGWLGRRRFRMGQTHGRLLGESRSPAGRIVQVALAGAKASCCFLAAALTLPSPRLRYRLALRGVLHAGTIGGICGMRESRHYGQQEPDGGVGHAA